MTTRDLAQILDVSKPAASVILARARPQGSPRSHRDGDFTVLRPCAIAIPWATSTLVLIADLLDGHDYYVGGPIALTAHRLTEQMFHGVVDVFVGARRLNRKLGNGQVIFHTHRWLEAYTLGVTGITVSSTTVRMSDPERTLLDIVDHPSLLGAHEGGIATVERALDRIDLDRSRPNGARWPQSASRQRLGSILERNGVNHTVGTTPARKMSQPTWFPYFATNRTAVPFTLRGGCASTWGADQYQLSRSTMTLPPPPSRQVLSDACRQEAANQGLDPLVVEKDFYLTRLIWALAQERGPQLSPQRRDLPQQMRPRISPYYE